MLKPTIFINGKITTFNIKKPEVSALTVVNGRIIDSGSDKEMLEKFSDSPKIIDLKQKRIIPGLTDAHAHFLGIGNAKLKLNLKNTISKEEVIVQVQKQIPLRQKDEWIIGRGWNQNDWGNKTFPNHTKLSAISSQNPVALVRIDGHALWCNQKAMELAQINAETPDPPGGKIIRDKNNKPTGVFIDKAMDLITYHIPKSGFEENMKAAKLAAAEAFSLGITSIHDAGINNENIEMYKVLRAENYPMPRLYLMLDGEDEQLLEQYFQSGPVNDDWLSIRSIKLYADGALGSRGAALIDPYSDDKLNYGLLLTNQEQLTKKTIAAIKHGFQMSVHAIGDMANRLVLDSYDEALQYFNNNKEPRLRIEHAQIIHPDDLEKFRRLNIIASVQPTHCTSDMPWVVSRLGHERTKNEAYVWRSLLNNQIHITAGSDAPIELLNPFHGIYAAVSRKDRQGKPINGFFPEQSLTREEAIKAFTVDAAYAEFQEHQKGHLSEGALADFVVLTDDIFKVDEIDIPKIQAEMTVLAGEIVFTKSEL